MGALEIGALILLASGTLATPVLGPAPIFVSMIGLVLVWVSSAWTFREKTVATVTLLGMLFLGILLVLAFRTSLQPAEVSNVANLSTGLVVFLIAFSGLLSATYLVVALARRGAPRR